MISGHRINSGLQLDVMHKQPDVDMVQGQLRQFVSPEVDEHDKNMFVGHGRTEPALLPGTTLVRREAFWRVGRFNTDLSVGYFADWMFRAHEADLKSVMLDDVILERRLHPQNQTLVKSDHRSEYVLAAKASLDRRRDNKFDG